MESVAAAGQRGLARLVDHPATAGQDSAVAGTKSIFATSFDAGRLGGLSRHFAGEHCYSRCAERYRALHFGAR